MNQNTTSRPPVRIHRFAAGTFAAVCMIAVVGTASSASADPVLDTADVQVQVGVDGSATVEMDYSITGGQVEPTGADTLTFSALDFGNTELQDLQITTAQGSALEPQLETLGSKTSVTTALAEPLDAGETADFVVRYVVPGAGIPDGEAMTAQVPMLTLDNPATTAAPGTFTATVELPSGYAYVEGFPSNTSDITESASGSTMLHYSVPAAPALLRSVSTQGNPPLLTTELLMELILLLVIILGIIALYYSFVRPHRRSDADTIPPAPAIDRDRGPVHSENRSRGL